jgi:Protein of unknown function (DUF3592)
MGDWRAAAVVLAASVSYSIALAVATLRGRASKHWPRVSGILDRSEIFIAHDSIRRPSRLAGMPYVSYDYRVGGTAYGGYRLRFGPVLLLSASHWIHSHAKGSSVTVSYDPRRPGRSVLESGVSPMLAACLVLALVVDGIGVWWLLGLLRG